MGKEESGQFMTEELYSSVGGERGMVGAQTPTATLSWFIFWFKIKSKGRLHTRHHLCF